MYRQWIKRLGNILLLGSAITLGAGVALFLWPHVLCAYLGLPELSSTLFARTCGLMIFLFGAVYTKALINRDVNRTIFWLGGFEKMLFASLLAVYTLIEPLSWMTWIVVGLDLALGVTFFVYLKIYREDNWL
ncbi:MAG: hypothetical protein P9M14_04670 [Candidatus Alcyoniella australis]|nr:hypothetical protein [Candidatus Alcyoniella australis]